MSRPIAYNTPAVAVNGSITNEDKVISYVVDGRGNDYYNGYADRLWVPSADGAAPIVFVTDTYTRGIEADPLLSVPLFFACAGTSSAAILYTANRLPGSPGNYSNANTALDELNRIYGYFILESNDPFQGDFQNGNLLTIDASKMTSYPQTANNWYDMSGNGFSFSLVNGPSFQSGGWFNIDGTDDAIILTGNSALQSTNTLVVWLRTTDTTGLLLTGSPLNSTGPYYVAAYYPGQGFYSGTAGSPDYFMNTLATINPATPINYLDGRFHMWEVKGLSFGGWTTTWNFFNYQAGYQIAGDVAKIQMFNSYLTAAQSKQLYFGSPIVTDGLVFAVDANNIVSYPKSGTAWYSLTGSITNTLINGPTFNLLNGGAIVFDGVDDRTYADSPVNENNSITLETWIYPTGYTNVGSGGGGFLLSNVSYYFEYASTGVIRSYFAGLNSPGYHNGTINIPLNTWAHVVVVRNQSDSTIKHYVNGNLDNTISGITGNINNGANNLSMGAYSGGGYAFVGKIANGRVYNRALSAAEIQQNYQAEQYRFEGPAGIVTNGLTLWLDAGNLDSYPGTGTTWYDLSGNNNNGALKSAAQWSNLGWMNYDGNNTDTETTVATVEINTNSAQGNTVEQWIYGAALNGNGNMPFTWLDYGFDLWWYNNLFGINNGNSLVYGISGANSVLLNNWVHVVAYFPYNWAGSYTNAKLWINGVAQSMAIVQGGLVNITLPSSLNVGIGGGYTSGQDTFNWNGRISQTRIYTRELTTAEVQQNYNATKAKFGL